MWLLLFIRLLFLQIIDACLPDQRRQGFVGLRSSFKSRANVCLDDPWTDANDAARTSTSLKNKFCGKCLGTNGHLSRETTGIQDLVTQIVDFGPPLITEGKSVLRLVWYLPTYIPSSAHRYCVTWDLVGYIRHHVSFLDSPHFLG